MKELREKVPEEMAFFHSLRTDTRPMCGFEG